MKFKEIFKLTWLPVVAASLCCLSPIIVVLAGVGSVALASSLADTLYGDYKWLFRIIGLVALALSVMIYLRRTKGICTLDDAKRRRSEIINIVAISITAGIIGYVAFLYVILHYVGVFLDIWK